MKKRIFTICSSILFVLPFCASAQGPITLGVVDNGTYINVSTNSLGVETDSLAAVDMSTAVFPDFSARPTGYNWDLTSLFYTSTRLGTYSIGTSPYQNQDSIWYSFGPLKYYVFEDNFFVGTGWSCHGHSIDTQAIVLPRTHGTTHDTTTFSFTFSFNYLYSPAKNLTYRNILPFNTTMGTSWSSVYHFTHPFTIKDTNPNLHYTYFTPGHHIEYVTETNNVVGYGKMKINSIDSIPTRLIDVLQIAKVKTYLDSIYIINLPAGIYDTIGLNHSYTTKIYEMDFCTTQLMSPLAKIIFTDSTMTTVQSAEISVGNLSGIDNSTAGVEVLTKSGTKMTVYPNPVSGNQFAIEIADATAGSWSYELYNISGQLVLNGTMPLGNGTTKAQISIPSNIGTGMYFIHVNHDGSAEANAPVLISR